MHRRFFCGLLSVMLLAAPFARADDGYCPDLIRLHVVANGDSAEEQALKLEVRDAVLAAAREILGECESVDAAWRILTANIGEIEAAAREVAGDARAELGVFDFPEREYDGVIVPAGKYRALRVVIGAGAGANWWCVIYPALCAPGGDDVVYYSAVIGWLRTLFGGAE